MATDVQATPKVKRFVCDTMMFGRFKRLFFVGIGGAGMSGIAEILHNLGYQIKGSDTTPSEVTDYLEKLGIQIAAAHKAVNVADSDVVVISSAVGESNPEVVEARRMGLPVSTITSSSVASDLSGASTICTASAFEILSNANSQCSNICSA